MSRDIWNELGRLEEFWPELSGIREHMKNNIKNWDKIYGTEKSVIV